MATTVVDGIFVVSLHSLDLLSNFDGYAAIQ